MTTKKKQIITPKKSDKKKTEQQSFKENSGNSKQKIRKRTNEFGDNDSL